MTALATAAGVLLIGLAVAIRAPAEGALWILAAAGIAGWAIASYRRKLWAWRIAVAFCFLVFLLAAVLLTSLSVAYVLGFGAKGKALLGVAAGTLIVLAAYAFTFWQALRELWRERGAFDSASALERTLGRPAW